MYNASANDGKASGRSIRSLYFGHDRFLASKRKSIGDSAKNKNFHQAILALFLKTASPAMNQNSWLGIKRLH